MNSDKATTAAFARLCVVPKVKGKRLAAARLALRRAACTVGKVKRAYSKKVKKGRVLSQKPRPGAQLPAGTKVNLVISKGKKKRR